jgi:hypothetical protein
LSKEKLAPAWPIERRPPSRRRNRRPAARGGALRLGRGTVGRRERVQREQVLQVGQHQLLVLLLVVPPDLEDRRVRGQRAESADSRKRRTCSSTWRR